VILERCRRLGVVAQGVNADGSPSGPAIGMPRSQVMQGRVTFTVTDAGDPVRGAVVRAGGRSGRTDRQGRVTLRFSRGTATASAQGYTPATRRVR
jgi:hypothetical protein